MSQSSAQMRGARAAVSPGRSFPSRGDESCGLRANRVWLLGPWARRFAAQDLRAARLPSAEQTSDMERPFGIKFFLTAHFSEYYDTS